MLNWHKRKTFVLFTLFFFTWFTLFSQSLFSQSDKDHEDILLLGIDSYKLGDYEKSLQILEEYIQYAKKNRENLARAYYYLAKNYYAVEPELVKSTLLKAFEANWFLKVDEKDIFFKEVANAIKQSFLDSLPVNLYLKRADRAYEQGNYNLAIYFYRLIAEKFPAKTFEQQIGNCNKAQEQKSRALNLYKKNQWEEAYIELRELLKVSPADEMVKSTISRIESDEILPLIKTAEDFFAVKNYKGAIPLFEKVLEFMPNNREMQARLTVCREMISKDSQNSESKSIEKEGVKKKRKRKFPILPVILGSIAVGGILFLLFKKKKETAPTTGDIKVESSPNEASIWLDNKDTGKITPAILTDIQAGSHTVKLAKDGYLDYEVTINVEPGKETLIFATLTLAPTPNFLTNQDSVSVPEGGQNTFQVKLSEQPLDSVNASVAWISGDTDIAILSGHNLTFTEANWDTYQAVTLRAIEDDDAANGEAIFRISAAGVPDKDIIAVEQDRGGPGYLAVTPNSGFTSSGFSGGPFTPSSKTYILENTGTGSIHWTTSASISWISLSAAEGNLDPNSSTTVTLSINNNAYGLPTGTHTGTITFLNSTNGGGSTSRTVVLDISTADILPTVTFTGPANGSTVSGTVTIQVTASDDKGINKVEIYVDNVLKATLTGFPYTYQWDTTTVSDGTHILRAIAYDTSGQTADDQISVTVQNNGG